MKQPEELVDCESEVNVDEYLKRSDLISEVINKSVAGISDKYMKPQPFPIKHGNLQAAPI